MITESERLDALNHYNETMAARYGLRRVAPSELDDIAWDAWEPDVIGFPDSLGCIIARWAHETTFAHTVAWVRPDGMLNPALGPLEPPIAEAYAIVFSGMGDIDGEAASLAWVKQARTRARQQRIVTLALETDAKGRRVLAQDRLRQVAWVFGVAEPTIKEWRKKHRGPSEPGRPPKWSVLRR